MRIAAGILTWNPLKHGRKKLLQGVVDSLADADSVTVFDNGSSEEYDLDAQVVKFPKIPGFPHANTCGYGMNKIATTLRYEADVVILSNDDIVWKPDAVETLRKVWTEAPPELTIISGLVEPTFALPDTEPWNLPFGTLELSGHNLLARKSVPGGAWTFRTADYDRIFPVSTFPGVDDVPACHRLVAQGQTVACIDLATHERVESSTWGNASHQRLIVTPVEQVREEYGV